MNVPPPTFWPQFLAPLAVEVALVAGLAAALQWMTQSAVWRRTLWQAAMLGLATLMVVEVTGASRGLMGWLRAPRERPQSQSVLLAAPQDSPHRSAVVTVRETPAPVVIPQPGPPEEPFAWWPGMVWLLVSSALAVRRGLARLVFALLGRRRRIADDAALSARVRELADRLGIRWRVRIMEAKRLAGPVAYGIFRPAICLPEGFVRQYSAAQQEAMLAHELAHLAARDPAWYWLADWLAAVLWWHPLVWWARGQLHASSEAAADEASLLLENGPDVLAECLVTLGRQLVQSPASGWLGIEGNGFRSGLGRRVQRLMRMSGQSWCPVGRMWCWLAKTVGPVALVLAVIAGTAWTLPHEANARDWRQSWSQSLVGLALATLQQPADSREPAEVQPKVAPLPAFRGVSIDRTNNPSSFQPLPNPVTNEVDALIQKSKLLYEVGRYDDAETSLRLVLQQDPDNRAAIYYLDLVMEKKFRGRKSGGTNVLQESWAKDKMMEVAQTWAVPNRSNLLSVPKPYARSNAVQISQARSNTYAKLERIRIDSIQYDGVPLSEVVRQLSEDIKKRDPEMKGVNFIIATSVNRVDTETGLPVTPQPEPFDLGATAIELIPPLQDVSLLDLLDVIVKVADKPIKYSVEDYGVVFSPKTVETPPLYNRFFKVDTITLIKSLESMMGKKPTASATNLLSTNLIALVREFFAGAGVDLSPPKNVFFNDRLGMFMVRATRQDLDTVEQALQVLNMSPPQLTIEAKFCEVTTEDDKALGFDHMFGGMLTNGVRKAEQPDSTNAALATATSILTESQFRVMLKALEQRSGVDVLSMPKITTLSGRQAQIKVANIQYVVTDLGVNLATNQVGTSKASEVSSSMKPITEPFEVGPVLDVVPYVAADGFTIQMTIIATVKEFLGYDWKEGFIATVRKGNAKQAEQATPLPRFRLRQVVSTATVWDGQTVILYGGSITDEVKTKDKVPVLGDVRVPVSKKKNLLVFITPTIIDPAGNRVHTDDELPFRKASIPRQPPPAAQ